MRKVERQIQVLRPGEVDLHIVVELRREFGVAFLITIRIHIGAEGIKHPVVGSLDAARITGAYAVIGKLIADI